MHTISEQEQMSIQTKIGFQQCFKHLKPLLNKHTGDVLGESNHQYHSKPTKILAYIESCFMSFDCVLQLEIINFNVRRGGKEGFMDWARRLGETVHLTLSCSETKSSSTATSMQMLFEIGKIRG